MNENISFRRKNRHGGGISREIFSKYGSSGSSSSIDGHQRGHIPGDRLPWPGFSLVELLVAFTVIMVTLLTTAQVLILSQAIQNRYRDHIRALGVISERLEHFRSLPFDSPELAEGLYSEVRGDPGSERSFTLSWTISVVSPAMKSVSIACARTGYPERKTETILFLSRDLEF
jgi:type II secretory pathway pseudopilin PulG